MQCNYINLKSRSDKRALIEASFNEHKISGWELVRFDAIDKGYVEKNKIAGQLPSGEKGCFLSHRQIIKNSCGSLGHLFIAEDDVAFGAATFFRVDEILHSVPDGWDILFLDICVSVPEGMIQLFKMAKELKAQGAITLLDLRDKAFGSAASYIVNQKSIGKLSDFLEKFDSIDVPIDLIFKELIHTGQLIGLVTFPFLTTLSSLSEKSDLQSEETYVTELVWHTFRKLVWNESKRADYQDNLSILERLPYDQDEEDFNLLLKGFLNRGYVGK